MSRPSKSELQREQGFRLRLCRERRHLTQTALGEMMGVGSTTVQAWEGGRNQIDVVALAWVVRDLGVTTDYIILGDLGGLTPDVAAQLQQMQRAYLANPPKPRGPKPQPKLATDMPKLRDIPEPGLRVARRTLHAPSEPYIPPPPRRYTHDT